jgi:hypothetical protein
MTLYPPILEGNLPPCYFEYKEGEKEKLIFNLPYSYSRGVNPNEIKGIKFIIKTIPLNNTIF